MEASMHLHMLFVLLSVYVSVSECTCRSGFEITGEVINGAEKQLDKVFDFANTVCPPCVNDTEFGCFINLLNKFKMDLADLRTFQYSIIDSFLNSTCSFNGSTLFVGPFTDDLQSQKITDLGTTELSFNSVFGIDCELREDLLLYADSNSSSGITKTDGNGTNPMTFFNGLSVRPKIFDSNTVYYIVPSSGIWRLRNGVSEQVVSNEVSDFEIDLLEGSLYWSNLTIEVYRSTVDGENIEVLFTDPDQVSNLALDSFTRRLYYTVANREVRYYDLRDGSMGVIAPAGDQPSDISVCGNLIYIALSGTTSKVEIRTTNGTVVGDTDFGAFTFPSIATCNLIP